MSENVGQEAKWIAENMMQNVRSLQRVAQDIERNTTESLESDPVLFTEKLLAVPILLSLATEIALKALLCWEKTRPRNELMTCSNCTNPWNMNIQEMLEARMRKLSPYSVWGRRAKHAKP